MVCDIICAIVTIAYIVHEVYTWSTTKNKNTDIFTTQKKYNNSSKYNMLSSADIKYIDEWRMKYKKQHNDAYNKWLRNRSFAKRKYTR